MRNPSNREEKRIENETGLTEHKKKSELCRLTSKERAARISRDADKLFFNFAEKSNDVIMIIDVHGEILYVNSAGNKLKNKNSINKNNSSFLLDKMHDDFKETIKRCLTNDLSTVTEQPGPESTWWLVRLIPIQKYQSSRPVVVAFCTDITEHRIIEKETIRLNRVLSMVGKCNEILVRSNNETDFLRDACRAIADIGGYRLVWVGLAEHDKTKSVRPVAHAGFEDGYLDTINITWAVTKQGAGPTGTAIRTGKSQVMRNILRDPNYAPWRSQALKRGYASSAAIPMISEGQILGALNVYSHELDAFGTNEVPILMELAGDLAYGIKSLRNKSERIRLNKALFNHRNKLRSLTMELALAEERERHRIALGIHDEIGQKLAITKMYLQELEHHHDFQNISVDMSHVYDRIDEILKDTRSLTFELSNPLLHAKNLIAAIKYWLKQNIPKKHGIKVELNSNLHENSLDTEVRITLFQVIRELLTNVVKHAKTMTITIDIQEADDMIEIVIEDNGVGFEVAETLKSSVLCPRGHFGLFNVRERIKQLGGRLDIASELGYGTRIKIIVAKKYAKPNLKMAL